MGGRQAVIVPVTNPHLDENPGSHHSRGVSGPTVDGARKGPFAHRPLAPGAEGTDTSAHIRTDAVVAEEAVNVRPWIRERLIPGGAGPLAPTLQTTSKRGAVGDAGRCPRGAAIVQAA